MALAWWRNRSMQRVVVSRGDPPRDCAHGIHHVYVATACDRQAAHLSLHAAQGWIVEHYPEADWLRRRSATLWECLDASTGYPILVAKLVVRGVRGWTIEAPPGS